MIWACPACTKRRRRGPVSSRTAAGVSQLFGGTPVDRMLAATFEMAVADAELREAGRSLAEDLGVGEGFKALVVGAVVGIPDAHDIAALRLEVPRRRGGWRRPGPAEDRARGGWSIRCASVRADHPDVVLQVDANGSFGGGRGGRCRPEPAGRLRRAVHRATAASGRPGSPRGAGPRAPGSHLPGLESLSTPRRVSAACCATARAQWLA